MLSIQLLTNEDQNIGMGLLSTDIEFITSDK